MSLAAAFRLLAPQSRGGAFGVVRWAGAGRRQLKLLFISRLVYEVREARKNFRCRWIVRPRGDMLKPAVLLFDTGPYRAPHGATEQRRYCMRRWNRMVSGGEN